jgi:hypothetical protein
MVQGTLHTVHSNLHVSTHYVWNVRMFCHSNQVSMLYAHACHIYVYTIYIYIYIYIFMYIYIYIYSCASKCSHVLCAFICSPLINHLSHVVYCSCQEKWRWHLLDIHWCWTATIPPLLTSISKIPIPRKHVSTRMSSFHNVMMLHSSCQNIWYSSH